MHIVLGSFVTGSQGRVTRLVTLKSGASGGPMQGYTPRSLQWLLLAANSHDSSFKFAELAINTTGPEMS